MTLKVSDIGEKELVRYIIANSRDITPDDTAITNIDSGNLISTCDMLIQSRHFPANMSYFEMGFKSVTVNVSDLAAMGAKPYCFTLSINLPDADEKFLEENPCWTVDDVFEHFPKEWEWDYDCGADETIEI